MKIFKIKYPTEKYFTKEKSLAKRKLTYEYLIKILSQEYHIKVEIDDFARNENGKPYLKNSTLFFNLSHSNQFMLVAFSNNALGIDIEESREIDTKSLSKRFFSPEEDTFIFNSDNKQSAFFRMWTLKESYIKWKGGSLPRDLQKFHIDIKENMIEAYEDGVKVDKLYIKEFRMDNYFIAVCSDNDNIPNEIIDFE